jgi:hypothetical protein
MPVVAHDGLRRWGAVSPARASRLVLGVVCLLVLTACRLDVLVEVAMEPDGTGVVTVTATADDELLAEVPGLVDDLRLDDAVANGWAVDGPTPLDGGGSQLVLSHPFTSAAELANVLTSIGPPLTQMAAARTEGADGQIVNGINGNLVLADGYESFADAELITAAGGLPFGDEIAASGVPIDEALTFTYRVSLPGELQSAETGTDIGDGVVEWVAPLDGSTTNLYIETVQQPPGSGNTWAGPIATVTFVTMVIWIVLAGAFIVFVAVARRNRRRRREQRLRRLEHAS